jgi:hypothetical protein
MPYGAFKDIKSPDVLVVQHSPRVFSNENTQEESKNDNTANSKEVYKRPDISVIENLQDS